MEVDPYSTVRRAFRWENGQITDLGTLGKPATWSSTNAINDFGQIVGEVGSHAAFWQDDTTIIDLGTLGGRRSNAIGINNLGQVIGSSETASDGKIYGFLWDSIDGMQDLNSLIPADSGWVITGAAGINQAGQIVGTGIYNGKSRGVLLTAETQPIPEPTSALGVLGLGAIGVGSRLLRKRK